MGDAPQLATGVPKAPSGVRGLDEVLGGGLPRGRATLLAGAAGCGKTLFAVQFLDAAVRAGEPGVLVSFEERPDDLAVNARSLGIDLDAMQADGMLVVDHVPLDPDRLVESGSYDLEGLLLRLGAAVDEVGATHVAIDTVEVLFGALSDPGLVRAELKRLFGWLRERELTAVITAEAGDAGRISRHGIEEYVSDCVIVLDHRVVEQHSTRRLRVVKYRGSSHGADEHPFLISDRGITVLPVTSLRLAQPASTERIGTGVDDLDTVFSGGIYRGSSVLISGSAGTGKTTIAVSFADGACRRGHRVLYLSHEESPDQIQRDMAAVGFDLRAPLDAGVLRFHAVRPTLQNLEAHLDSLHQLITEERPELVVIDPITSFTRIGDRAQVASMLIRVVDTLKSQGITAVLTGLTPADRRSTTLVDVSSLVDAWLHTEIVERDGVRARALSIVKARGIAHSDRVIGFRITDEGIRLLKPDETRARADGPHGNGPLPR